MKTKDSGAQLAALMTLDKSNLPADGGNLYNRLIFARSPYLLQHAENPVDWYEWGSEAFDKARRDNLPIFLSIGYATCHWCHVMAHESFEDEDVATLLNRHFICIKVDREERPDIDDFYMSVSQLLTGGGGWPLNIFMTPDKEAFFAMTYLPKRGRGGMGGFMEMLSKIAAFWKQKPEEIRQSSRSIMDVLDSSRKQPSGECAELSMLNSLAFEQLSSVYDNENGGFGSAPKFPMPIYLSWLMEQGAVANVKAQEMAFKTLVKMRHGGIWDQLGGGLHRYAVDQNWLTPHFEKMLYDQAMISMAAIEAFQATSFEHFFEMANDIFRFVENELMSADGVYYSALDADSEGEEGVFYVWSKEDITDLLGPDAELFCRYFDVTAAGNFEGSNILNRPLDLATFSKREGRNEAELKLMFEEFCAKLLSHRNKRIRPLRDEKIIAAWNGLMIAALARGGIVSGNMEYINKAARAASFILGNLRNPDGRLMRSYLAGKVSDTPAFLEDYAFMCQGLLELYEATLDKSWLNQALELADDMIRLFRDGESGQFGKTGCDAEQMPGRTTLDHDGVTPSPFSMTSKCFARLGHVADRSDLIDYAQLLLAPALDESKRNPVSHLGSLQALAMLENEPTRIDFSGSLENRTIFELLQMIKALPFHNLVLTHQAGDGPVPSVSICAMGKCLPAVSTASELEAVLAELI